MVAQMDTQKADLSDNWMVALMVDVMEQLMGEMMVV